uniref:PDZ domain-containing protein n=1 Tax=Acidobacterium capsulatum TaxID=33075 RepID=A0A7V5CT68_9BACT
MSRNFKHVVLGLAAAVILVIFLGGFAPAGVNSHPLDNAYQQMGVYEEVLHKIQADYVTVPDLADVTTGALHGLLESLDGDSAYLTPAEYKQYLAHQNDGTAQVGLIVSSRAGYATVVSVVPDSPAAGQKIQDGDMIEAINGQSTYNMSVAMVRLLLQGQPGSKVTLRMIRAQSILPVNLTMTRADNLAPALEVKQYASSNVLYIKPYSLTAHRVDEVIAKLKSMPANTKVLLDLRDSAQGTEADGLRLANAFIQSGTLASLHGQTLATKVFQAKPEDFVTHAPLVVLVNHGTAGAAEIVAGAVLDDKRGDVVGDPTFGEGALVKTITLPDGAAVLLTVGKYETPDGTAIEDKAITPNYLVDESIDSYLAEEGELPASEKNIPIQDDQLNKGLSLLQQKKA